jgi:hypothetical protein
MSQITDERSFLVLNGAHLKKMATAEEIAVAVGVDPELAERTLALAVGNGWAMDMEGKFLLLPDGTAVLEDYYRLAYQQMRADPRLVAWYDRFERLNEQFIKHVTNWQAADGDDGVQAKLLKTVERLTRSLDDIIPSIPRYEGYARRFAHSVSRVDLGDKDFVCKPTIDSVHNIWFEFHEDILSVLGRPRDV